MKDNYQVQKPYAVGSEEFRRRFFTQNPAEQGPALNRESLTPRDLAAHTAPCNSTFNWRTDVEPFQMPEAWKPDDKVTI